MVRETSSCINPNLKAERLTNDMGARARVAFAVPDPRATNINMLTSL